MATPNIVPRAAGEGGLGAAAYGWGGAFITNTTTTSASQGGKLVLAADDGAVMASGHRLGAIEFKGAENTSNTLTTGARIEALCDATWSTSENGASLYFYTTDGDASETNVFKLDSDKKAIFPQGIVGIGTSTPLTGTEAGMGLDVENTATSSSDAGGAVRLSSNDGQPMASGHRLGIIEFAGAEDTASTMTVGARIEALTDATWSDTENGASLKFYTTDADATQFNVLTLDSNKKATFTQTLTTAATTPIGVLIDANYSGVAAQDSTGLHLDFDRTVAGSGTAQHRDIGINLDINSASLGAHTVTGMDIDVVGATSGTSTAVGIDLDVDSSDTNIGMQINTAGTHMKLIANADVNDYATFTLADTGDLTIATVGSGTTDSDLILDADGDIEINADGGDIRFKDASTALAAIDGNGALTSLNYRTIWVDAGAMVPATTNGAAVATEEMHATNFTTMDYLAFDKATEEYADFKMVMPEQYNNSTVKVKFYWKPSDSETGVSVIWGIKAYAATEDDTLAGGSGVWGTAQEIESTDHSTGNLVDDDLYISTATPAMTINGTPAEGKLVFFRVYRKAADGTDDYDADAHLLGVNIQYQETLTASAGW